MAEHRVRKLVAIAQAENIAGANPALTVNGEFEFRASNETASLREAKPQGIVPKTLILDLIVTAEGMGSDVIDWKAIEEFKKPGPVGTYETVEVRSEGKKVGEVEVENRIS